MGGGYLLLLRDLPGHTNFIQPLVIPSALPLPLAFRETLETTEFCPSRGRGGVRGM